MVSKENIKLLIENHLIGVWVPETEIRKESYLVTAENAVDFIEKYFTLKRAGAESLRIIKNNKK